MIQRGPSALLQKGQDFNEALVRSRTGAKSSMRPRCDPAQGP